MTRARLALTLDIDLLARLEAAAADRGVPLRWLVEQLLTESLELLPPAAEFTLTRKDPAS